MEDFIQKVAEMRRLQKQYFSSRDPLTLQACKRAEREIDDILSNNQHPVKTVVADALQPILFEQNNNQ
jgi:hypothetical protein